MSSTFKITFNTILWSGLFTLGGLALCPVAKAAAPVTNGLALWLDASDLNANGQTTPDGTPVTVWRDKSGNTNDAAATGSLTSSAAGLNGHPTVNFTGSAFCRTVAGAETLHDDFTMVAVFQKNAADPGGFITIWGNEANGQRRGMLRSPTGVFAFNGYWADLNSSTQVAPNQPYIGAISKASGSSGLMALDLNGDRVATGNPGLVDFSSSAITVGADNDPNNIEFWNGSIAEVLIYNRQLSAQEMNQTGLYLKNKYGVTATYSALKILSQPQGLEVQAGANVAFEVEAVGDEPLHYQWFKDASPITGANGTNLVLNGVRLPDAGSYSVVVTNVAGSLTSAVATLVVSLARSPATNGLALWLDATDMNADGQPDATADEAAVSAWLDKSGNGNDAFASSALTYATGGLNGRPAVSFDGTGFFRTGAGAESLHDGFTMVAVFQDRQTAYSPGFAVIWGNEATGQRRGMLRNPNGLFCFNGYFADVVSSQVLGYGANYIGVVNKASGVGGVVALDLNGQRLATGAPAFADYFSTAITVGADNDPNNVEQWKGAIAEVLVYDHNLSDQDLNQTGNYLRVKYGLSAAYSDLALTAEPQSQTVLVGANVTFSTTAVGVAPFQYQWYKGVTALANATNSTLSLNGVQLSDTGDYYVVVSNSAGSVTSSVAYLAVSLPGSPVTAGLTLWLNAADMDADGQPDTTADGAPVTVWRDKSGHGNDATAASPLTYSATGFNGRPAVNFNGSGFFRTTSGGQDLHGAFTMIAVFQSVDTTTASSFVLIWGNEANGQRRGMIRRGGDNTFCFNGYIADVNSAAYVAPTQFYIGAITKGPGVGDAVQVYLDGSALVSGTPPLVDYTSQAITVGANNDPNNSEQWKGQIAEVLIYNRQLSAQELNQTGLYLALNYAIPTSYVVPPTLSIGRSASGVVVSWPSAGPGWVLQSTDTLPSGSWTTVAGVTNNQLTIPASDLKQFYRLSK